MPKLQLFIFYSLRLEGEDEMWAGLGIVAKNGLIHFEQGLHGNALGLHVAHFALNGLRPHDCRCEDNGKVEGCHLRRRVSTTEWWVFNRMTYEIFTLMRHDFCQMEN